MSCKWDHTAVFGIWLLSFIIKHLRFIHVVTCINLWFLFIFKYHSVTWIYHYLFHHLPFGHLGFFILELLQIKLLWAFTFKCLCEYVFCFLIQSDSLCLLTRKYITFLLFSRLYQFHLHFQTKNNPSFVFILTIFSFAFYLFYFLVLFFFFIAFIWVRRDLLCFGFYNFMLFLLLVRQLYTLYSLSVLTLKLLASYLT